MGDPASQAPVGFVIDRDCVWRVVLALVRCDDAAVDPVINNAFADAIAFAKLTDAERIGRGHRSRDPVFVAYPFDHAVRKRLTRRALVTLGAEELHDLVIMMVHCQFPNAGDECLGIPHCVGAVEWQMNVQGFCGAALPADVQLDSLGF